MGDQNILLAFILSVIILLLVSQRSLTLAMFLAAFTLGMIANPNSLLPLLLGILLDPSATALALTVGLIPLIGEVMSETGQMDRLIGNMRIGRRAFLMLSPALIGMLTMPGGALLSAPIVDRAGGSLPRGEKAGINVWFRHILYLVYPISANFIVATEAANLELYGPIPYLAVLLLFSLLLGYIFLLRKCHGRIEYERRFSLRDLIQPLIILLLAPIMDASIRAFLNPQVKEAGTLIAVSSSLALAIIIGGVKPSDLRRMIVKAKPWSFAAMMIGIIFFLEVFGSSGIPESLRDLPLSPSIIYCIAFALGFLTGRIITPAGIIFPVYISRFGSISPLRFALIYYGIFLGYILTPVHPCVSLTIKMLKTEVKDYMRVMIPPVAAAALISLAALYFLA